MLYYKRRPSNEYRVVARRLEEISGELITDEKLAKSFAQSNRHNLLLMKFCDLANEHLDLITPPVRHAVMKSAWFMEVEEHIEILDYIIAELEQQPVHEWNGKRVILTGILAEPAALFDILEEQGVAVAGDDLASGSRQYRTFIPDEKDYFLGLATQWQNRDCSLIHDLSKTRITKIKEMVNEEQADGRKRNIRFASGN